MSVRFIIGRAGTGKTHHCLSAIRERLRENAVDGPRLILLVPEQASQQMERALLLPRSGEEPIAAAHRAEVLSFQRLAFRVLESVGEAMKPALTEAARAMVLRHLLTAHARRLQYYRRPERLGGLTERLSAAITEFIQEGIEPTQLVRESGEHGKIHDLAMLYAAYLDHLKRGFVDPSQYLAVARASLARCDWLRGAGLWVDGFASMGGEEIATLVSLAGLARHTDITVLLDPSLADPRGVNAESPTAALFRRVSETLNELGDAFSAQGLGLDDPLVLAPKTPPRFASSPSLATLEECWARDRGGKERSPLPPVPDGATLFDLVARPPPEEVELVELPSRRVEVEYAVSRIVQWVQSDPGFRYRDVAIIARDLEGYHELLTAALQARGIPFFLDRRRPIAHHPLVELLRSAVAIVREAMSVPAMRLLLKTDLLALGREDADELENYLLAHGVAGPEKWFGPDWTAFRSGRRRKDAGVDAAAQAALARVNAIRRVVGVRLENWWTLASPPGARTGGDWADALRSLFATLDIDGALQSWASAAEAEGRVDDAQEHRRVWEDVHSFLDDLSFAFADCPLNLDELGDVVDAGLSSLTLGLTPATIDQVLVGAIERSRHPDVKAAVLIGFNDGSFPQRPVEDSILNDDDRATLRDRGLRVGPPSRDRVQDESLLAYIALTRASDALVVTFATSDDEGKALRPSPYVETLSKAGGGLTPRVIGDPARERATWDILAPSDLRRRLAMEFRSRGPRDRDDRSVRERWNGLYEAVRGRLADDVVARAALRCLADRRPARLSAESVKRLFPEPLRTSVTQLETYAGCPFQHFARHVLRLEERPETTLKSVDVGHVQHAILEKFVARYSPQRIALGDLPEAELQAGLAESCRGVAAEMASDAAASDARRAYVMRQSGSRLARVLRVQQRIAKAGRTRLVAAELAFGDSTKPGLPPLGIDAPSGRHVQLRGFIDRVDVAGAAEKAAAIVVDYKHTSRKLLNLAEVYHGVSLQLMVYLLVLREHGRALAGHDISPAAALFVSLPARYQRVDYPGQATPRESELEGTNRPRGLIREDILDTLVSPQETRWLNHYAVYMKNDRTAGDADKGDAASAVQFKRLLDHVRAKLGELCDAMLSGRIGVEPYRLREFTPCQWCRMRAVCGFEMGLDPLRSLPPLSRSQVFTALGTPPATDDAGSSEEP